MTTNPMKSRGIAIELAYFETDRDGFIERSDFPLLAPLDAPLMDSILELPPIKAWEDQDGYTIMCRGETYNGEIIDMMQKPYDIEYIFNSLYMRKSPVLYVIRTRDRHDSGVSMSPAERGTVICRRPSGLIECILGTSVSKLPRRRIKQTKSDDGSNILVASPRSKDSEQESASDLSEPEEAPDEVFEIKRPHIKHTQTMPRIPMNAVTAGQALNTSFSFKEDDISESIHGGNQIASSATLQHRRVLVSETEVTVTPPIIRPRTDHSVDREIHRRRKAMKRTSTWDLNPREINVQLKSLEVTTEDGSKMTIPCQNYTTVGELKQAIGQELSLLGKNLALTLTYTAKDKTYELANDSQFLASTLFIKEVAGQEVNVTGIVARSIPTPSHKDLVTLYRICQLTHVLLDNRVSELGGKDIRTFTILAPSDRREVEAARRTLHDYVTMVTSERETESYALSVDITKDDTPTTFKLKIPVNNRIPVTFHYKKIFTFTKEIDIHRTAETVLGEIYQCLKACGLVSGSIDSYTLQISGIESYIHGKNEMITFTDIRRCITKREPVHLSVTLKPSTLLYQPFDISWLPLDPSSYEPPLQSDISQGFRNTTRSIWECDDEEYLNLTLVRVENLPFDHSTKNVLSVEFSLHLGSELIHGVRATSSKPQVSFTMKWNEEANFITKLRDLPKATKILVIIRNQNSSSYFWGLLTVFDHRSMLRSGVHTLYLWEVKKGTSELKKRRRSSTTVFTTPMIEKEEEALSTILSGPAADNPSASAVRVIINFGKQDKPVYYPSVSHESRNILFKQHPWVRKSKLRKHFSKYLEMKFNIRSDKGAYHNLPVHIQTINWACFRDRLEVYEVLDKIKENIESVPLYVAFRLLDKDFPDEEVRAFATRVVENRLSSDNLEDYLLQLAQALKFEPCHDNALARYLLKQALTNKRIGHMFFWYLRSEMHNPQYMPRFAVILEAYLKGCGEELLTKFMDQITMQDSLEQIGQKLKDEFGKDTAKMQQSLPKELINHDLHKLTSIPVYNPRLLLGGLRPEHCKVMSSAKKPLNLEMLNMNHTALRVDPVRLIMKMGDDLRQDMMTLKMLSLFDKLWENEGLDLKLIPYGCMATGARTGFIEVVKNSKTIAEVSGVRENKKLYEWIKSHQTDEFGGEDPDKLKTAIDTFVHSCAGYSVATYILGIGDRHNDNIMITTSGNLFHIDFGHFLGNIKYMMGFKREWAPFVLTPDFTYVMGGEDSDAFRFYKHLCIRAFLILRRHSDLIINLFSMMRSTGIPELTCVEDTDYIKTALALGKTDTEAEREFQMVIQKCLDLKWTVQVMWAIHTRLRGSGTPSPNKN